MNRNSTRIMELEAKNSQIPTISLVTDTIPLENTTTVPLENTNLSELHLIIKNLREENIKYRENMSIMRSATELLQSEAKSYVEKDREVSIINLLFIINILKYIYIIIITIIIIINNTILYLLYK